MRSVIITILDDPTYDITPTIRGCHLTVHAHETVEAWGNLKVLCEDKGWKYNTVSRLKFPFTYKGYRVHKSKIP